MAVSYQSKLGAKMNSISPLFRKSIKAVAAFSLLFVLAACQTTGLKPGNLQSGFSPAGWETLKKGQETYYFCLPANCRTLQIVEVGPIKVKGNMESAIRQNILSKQIVDSVLGVVKATSRGKIQPYPVRKISTPTYSGFEFGGKIQSQKRSLYLVGRWIIQENRGIAVTSVSTSRKVAAQNLRRYISQTRISRGR
jgi:hypothetical protein